MTTVHQNSQQTDVGSDNSLSPNTGSHDYPNRQTQSISTITSYAPTFFERNHPYLNHHQHLFKDTSSISKPPMNLRFLNTHNFPNFLALLPVLSMVVIQDFTTWLSPPVTAQSLGVSFAFRYICTYLHTIEWLMC